MSVEKEAAFRDTIIKAVRDAKRHHVMAGKDTGFSLIGTLLDVAAHNDAYGARAAQRGFKKFQRGVNMVDTAAGAALRGNAQKDSLRYRLWTDKDYIPVGKGRYIHHDNRSDMGYSMRLTLDTMRYEVILPERFLEYSAETAS